VAADIKVIQQHCNRQLPAATSYVPVTTAHTCRSDNDTTQLPHTMHLPKSPLCGSPGYQQPA
jgi:hypothetical protein